MIATTMTLLALGLTTTIQSNNPVSYLEAKGPIQWRVEDSKSPWASKALSQLDLSKYTVEAIAHITEDNVRAWRSSGELFPDFEGYLRTKIQNSENVKFQVRYKRKNRQLVLNTPSSSPTLRGDVSVSVNFPSNDGNLYELANESNSNGYRYQFVSISADIGHKFASIPAQIHLSTLSSAVPAKVGTEFSFLGNRYSIAEIRAFKNEDMKTPGRGYPQSRYFTTMVVKKLDGSEALFMNGSVDFPPQKQGAPYSQWVIDEKGNFVERKPNEIFPASRNIFYGALLQQIGEDPVAGTVTLVSNVNVKNLKTFRIHTSTTAQAWLDNIPLDPNPK